ncbi:MAG: cation-translocating P-type ATPase [Caldilineaceae bacterium]
MLAKNGMIIGSSKKNQLSSEEKGTAWHTCTGKEIANQLEVKLESGLSTAEAAQRLKRDGANELVEQGGRTPLRLLWEQFTATMVLILIAAALLSAVLQKWQEAGAILAIVVLFALLGFFQEYRAERAMAALKRLTVPIVRARRNGQLLEISSRELVVGDIILLEAGNVVPADGRLLESANLRVQEAALTGESEAVEKQVEALTKRDLPLGDRKNMVYMGTLVNYGRAQAVVTATGMKTELGKIAQLLQRVDATHTPLQKRLDQVGKALALLGLLLAGVIALFGVLRGESLAEMLLVGISVAVAIVPEGLPAVVTITLALGARRMLSRNALIRKLPAVETLGSVTVICSDKTGTLTENRMTVTVVDVAGDTLYLRTEQPPASTQMNPDVALLVTAGALCNDASIQFKTNEANIKEMVALGDPTELALVMAASEMNLHKAELEVQLPRVFELPFDSDRKRMTTLHQINKGELGLPIGLSHLWAKAEPGRYIAFTKGSVDGLLEIANAAWVHGTIQPLTPELRKRIEQSNDELAQKGMRVLGTAFQSWSTLPSASELEKDLIFVGLFGMIDPPRPEVKSAVDVCRAAGIRPIMITGDHPLTASAIAHELGIATNDKVLTGQNLSTLSDTELRKAVADVSVFARVSPEHKLRIVEALQANGQIVSMTGDGVNDAPALKKADIGVAMGITGTDVSKEAAEMVLRDDNFATIIAAVEEGRVIYDNIRKFVMFSLGGNIGKILVMLFAPMIALLLPASSLGDLIVPLFPLQLLWLNLLTDGLLGIGLGVEPAERGVMKRTPIPPTQGIFSRDTIGQVIRMGFLIGLIALVVGLYHWQGGYADWQTMMFATLAFAQMWQALGIRSGKESLFRAGLFSNPTLLGMVLVTLVLQLAAIYLPILQTFLNTNPLHWTDLLLCLGASALVFVVAEVEKVWQARMQGH